jgi:hypothetical protein
MVPTVTVHTDTKAVDGALDALKAAYADGERREQVEAFLDGLDSYGQLLAISSKVEGMEIYVTITPSERLTEFLGTVKG